MKIIYLTRKQIVQLHDYALSQDGGLDGIKEPGYLDLIAEKPYTTLFNEEQYPGLFLKAAIYMEGLATAHAFNDANKRTALFVMLTFMSINGYSIDADADDLFEVTILVATNRWNRTQLARWIEEHARLS
ncbi:death-on-curing protein [Paenibacillus swuensis]|uniref:Death-on-curing protein n=1 Tax=Paenibacillus swuensis TaxID=1178515 RepID=A0A172THT4_9BACL|nr:type II toxin-antitoxin system death-on-curing family toxin [Paenibacillus swuensis]ANE46618.1 death-on-curing protein [Paenibacillus swuensis]